jgi:hypothetical protein
MASVNGSRNGQLVAISDLSKKERRQLLNGPTGTAYDQYTRLFASFQDGDVFETGEWRARDIDLMLDNDGDAAMLEQALTLPMRSVTYSFTPAKGDTGEFELIQQQLVTPSWSGGLSPGLDMVLAQMAGASVYRKAFFEKQWEIVDGIVRLKNLQWRPPSTCAIKRDEVTAAFDGYRQRAWWFSSGAMKKLPAGAEKKNGHYTGYIEIPKIRAFVYIHGQHRSPLTGTSDMNVAYWCYKQKQKIMFLWFQFLECQSLPKIAAYGPDQDAADDIADALAKLKSSGVAGFERPPGNAKLFDIIQSSGPGAEQFQQAMTFLQAFAAKSIMGGFLDLGNAATLGRGSYALSESQSGFFLQARQGVVKEMCNSFTADITAPICILNKGPNAAIPTLAASPLTQNDSQQIISTLSTLAVAPALRVPDEYVLLVAQKAAEVLNLPVNRVSEIIDKAVKQSQESAAQHPFGSTPIGQGAAAIAGATQAGGQLVKQQRGGAANGSPNAAANGAAATTG